MAVDFSFKSFSFTSFDDLKPYFDDLLNRDVQTLEDTKQWIKEYDGLSTHIAEDYHWRYVHQSCDTANKAKKDRYLDFINNISPKLQEIDDTMNKKIVALPHIDELSKESSYSIWLRGVKKALDMFREENIPLSTQESQKSNTYGDITGAMTIEIDGKTLTLQQATKLIDTPDREIRKNIYEKIWGRRLEDKDTLDNLLTELIQLRTSIALNAGYPSYVEYKWDVYERFDYTQQDVHDFHIGVKQYIVPILEKIYEKQKQKLGLTTLEPFDLDAPIDNERLLRPFSTGEELLAKTTACMQDLDEDFAKHIRIMKSMNRFDLDSRAGKAPGGYNCGMPASGYSFIFMNAAGLHRDVETIVHEAGHMLHGVYEDVLPLEIFKKNKMEMAEVASMSMELLTMDYWHHFYPEKIDQQKAQKEQLEGSLETLCRVGVIDAFQYWLYKNPTHTIAERDQKFASLLSEYQPRVDYTNYKEIQAKRWQAQLHIYEVPFYYIEYGIAQLGAYGVRKNYKENKEHAIKLYKYGLSLGNTKTLPELYTATGIEFNFGPTRMKELSEFVLQEWEKIA